LGISVRACSSTNIISFLQLLLLLDKKGFIVGQKSLVENSIIKTLDKHAPIKRRKHIPQPAPFMNKQLRQAIYNAA
jgi:hypothetical protein